MYSIYDKENLGFEYDDVLIMPNASKVSSRDDVDISVKLTPTLTLQFPLIASPMVGVTDGKFVSQLSKLGGLGIFHRFYPDYDTMKYDIRDNISLSKDNFGMSIKVGSPDYIKYLQEFDPTVLLVDTANGYTEALVNYCEKIANYISKNKLRTLLIAGNVATIEGLSNLHSVGCDIIRVGIGGGSPCSTRNQTGIGVPNLTAIMNCSGKNNGNYKIIADGGIKNSGDFVKAVVAGADLGMSGKLFAECFEAPNKGTLYGMASRTHMKNTDTEIKSVEGIDIPIEKKHSLEQFVREFGYGIKSAGTYLNAENLNDIWIYGKFMRVTPSAIKRL